MIPHSGTALTDHGDVALTDPRLSYDEYHPYAGDPDLDLLVQFAARAESATEVSYRGN